MVDIRLDQPDIENSLRSPQNEFAYRDRYNGRLGNRVEDVLIKSLDDDEMGKPEVENMINIIRGEDGEMEVDSSIVRILSQNGLLRVVSTIAGQHGEEGWWEEKDMDGGKYKGRVQEYWVELPKEEAPSPVTTELKLAAKKQEKTLERDFSKWILSRTSIA